jgi:beta-lactamase class A
LFQPKALIINVFISIMKKFFTLIFFFFSWSIFAQNLDLKTYLDSLNQTHKISLMVQNSRGEQILAQQIDSIVPSASVIKIPILLELFKQVQNKQIKLSEKYILKNEDKVGGAGELQNAKAGKKLTINQLAKEMIRTSDNTATNILIQRLGMDKINQFLTTQNCSKTSLQRKMMDFEAIKQGRQNYANVLEINQLLVKLFNQEILNPKLSKKVMGILKKCEDNVTIPRYLPKSINIAHKTGVLDYVRGDAGIVFSPNILIISIFVEKFKDVEQAEEIIARLAALIVYQYGNLNK